MTETPRPLDRAPASGWWKASDGQWYPPESRPPAATSTTSSRSCPQCKGAVPTGASRCMHCGAFISRTTTPSRLLVLALIAIAIAGAFLFVAARSADKAAKDDVNCTLYGDC